MEITCTVCNGSMTDPENPENPCPACDGTGVMQADWYRSMQLRQEAMGDAVNDLSDKVNDIKEKVDEIKTVVDAL